MHRAAQALQHSIQTVEVPTMLARWAEKSYSAEELEQIFPLLFLIFQDTMLKLAVGTRAKNLVASVEQSLVCGELDV